MPVGKLLAYEPDGPLGTNNSQRVFVFLGRMCSGKKPSSCCKPLTIQVDEIGNVPH